MIVRIYGLKWSIVRENSQLITNNVAGPFETSTVARIMPKSAKVDERVPLPRCV